MRGVEQIPWLYDAWLGLMERGGLSAWRSWLVRGARGRTLDVGTGTGRDLPLYTRDAQVVAVDPDAAMLARARRRAPDTPLVRARAEALPFGDGAFDTVVSALVFCSVDDPDQGLTELRRVLRPGGTLRMMEHVRSEGRLMGRLQDLVQPAWTRVAGGCRPNRRTEARVERAGFAIDDDAERRSEGSMRRFTARPTG